MKKIYSLHLLFQTPATTVIVGLIGFLAIPFLLKPQNVPLFGSRVFAGVVRLRWGFWILVGPEASDGHLDKKRMPQRHSKDHVETEARIRVIWSQARECKTCWSHKKLRQRRISPQKSFKEISSKKTRPCHHLDFRLLMSSTARIKFCGFKPHSLWPFTIVAWGNSHPHIFVVASPPYRSFQQWAPHVSLHLRMFPSSPWGCKRILLKNHT